MVFNNKNYCLGCMNVIDENEKCSCGFDESGYNLQSQWLKPGTVLNDSILLGRVIGDGGFGITYMGVDLNLGMKVAVKEFYMSGYCGRNTHVSSDVLIEGKEKAEIFENNKNKFIDEARMLAKFSGEAGIVSFSRFFKENNTAYIVMEYLEGETLKEHVSKSARMSVKDTLVQMLPIINAIEKIHSQHIYHRDISPDNIILSKDRGMKLLDFGSAREKLDEYKTMTVVLKKAYSPVEQYETHGNQGPWTDIYSLCATMYFCMTGKNPDSAYDRFMNDTMPAVSETEPSCDAEISAIISKGMQVNAEDRYQSIEELKDDLNTYMNEHFPEVGKDLFYSDAAQVSEEKSDGKRDYFILSKKSIKRVAIAVIAALCILFSMLIIAKNLKEENIQIVYLTYPEYVEKEQIDKTYNIIKNRLDSVTGHGKYKIKKGETYSTFEIELDNVDEYSEVIMSKLLVRPNRLSLVYSTNQVDENVSIESSDIISFVQSEKSDGSGYIELNDVAAPKMLNAIDDWTSRTKSANIINNLGGTVIHGDEYDPSLPDVQQNDAQQVDSEATVRKCIRLMLDYDMWKAGYLGKNDCMIFEVEVSEDGHKLYVGNSENLKLLKQIFDNHFLDNSFEFVFDMNSSYPVIWERNVKKKADAGIYQREPEFFANNNIAAVDAVFKCEPSTSSLGDRIDFRQYIQSIFDNIESEYAVGQLADDEYSVVIRIHNKYAERELYDILRYFSKARKISIDTIDSAGDLRHLDSIDKEQIELPVLFEDACVYVNLLDSEEHDYAFGEEHELYWYMDSPYDKYLIGKYDKKNKRLIFDTSSYTEDGSIPTEFSKIIDVLNTVYEINTNGYSFNYKVAGEQNADKKYDELRAGVEHELDNNISKVILQNTKNKLTESLGAEPQMTESGSLYEVVLKQSITDNYAKNLTNIINSILDANIFEENGIYTLDSSKCLFRIQNLNGTNQANVSIDDKEKCISFYFWKDQLTKEEQDIFDSQIEKMLQAVSDGNVFAGYEVTVNNVW